MSLGVLREVTDRCVHRVPNQTSPTRLNTFTYTTQHLTYPSSWVEAEEGACSWPPFLGMPELAERSKELRKLRPEWLLDVAAD